MKHDLKLSADVLKLDYAEETKKITTELRQFLSTRLKRRGAVIANE